MSRAKDIDTPEGRVRHEAKFHRILDAALDVFVHKGFYRAKISEVARAAGVADGTIYLYFKNKDDLLASLLDVKLETLAKQLRHNTQHLGVGQGKLSYVVDFHLQLVQTQGSLMSLMRHEVHVGYLPWGSRARTLNNPYLAEWVRIIDEGLKGGALQSELSATSLMHLLFGALDHACNVWAGQKRAEGELEHIGKHIRTLLIGPITAQS